MEPQFSIALPCGQRRIKQTQTHTRDAAEPASPGRWYRPLKGEAPQAHRG